MLQGDAGGWLLACPGVTWVSYVTSRWETGRGCGHLWRTGKEELRKKFWKEPTRATHAQDKASSKTLCLVLLLSLSTKSSHELNCFQNKSAAAAGAGWGFHLPPGKQRNKSHKATITFSCRCGHTGTAQPSSSPGASLVFASNPALEISFLNCFKFQIYIPGEKNKEKKDIGRERLVKKKPTPHTHPPTPLQ